MLVNGGGRWLVSKVTNPHLDDHAQKNVYKREYLRLKYGGASMAAEAEKKEPHREIDFSTKSDLNERETGIMINKMSSGDVVNQLNADFFICFYKWSLVRLKNMEFVTPDLSVSPLVINNLGNLIKERRIGVHAIDRLKKRFPQYYKDIQELNKLPALLYKASYKNPEYVHKKTSTRIVITTNLAVVFDKNMTSMITIFKIKPSFLIDIKEKQEGVCSTLLSRIIDIDSCNLDKTEKKIHTCIKHGLSEQIKFGHYT